jgi:hypothetical protein
MSGVDTGLVGPDTQQLASLRWSVERDGRNVDITMMLAPGQTVAVYADAREIGRFPRPTLKAPWSEFPIPTLREDTKVVQIAYPHDRRRTLVFVAGVSVADGHTEAAWRAAAPAPMDDFEQFAASWLFGRIGRVLLGVGVALPVLVQGIHNGDSAALVFAVGGFAITASWLAVNAAFVRWLTHLREWPAGVRRLTVVFTLVGVPFLVVLALASWSAPR